MTTAKVQDTVGIDKVCVLPAMWQHLNPDPDCCIALLIGNLFDSMEASEARANAQWSLTFCAKVNRLVAAPSAFSAQLVANVFALFVLP